MQIIVVTGMSGAGKSAVAHTLEDLGYFCIDNLPAPLVQDLITAFNNRQAQALDKQKLALIMDVRSINMFGEVAQTLQQLRTQASTQIIFLEAQDNVLVSRYRLSRRNHPLTIHGKKPLLEAIRLERERLVPLREIADTVIDTSDMQGADLKQYLIEFLENQDQEAQLSIFLQSFGFKYGIPLDSDLVCDVRFIPNPFYQQELRQLSGLDAPVQEYVSGFPETLNFAHKQFEIYRELCPLYQREGKTRLVISIGCSGGRHRSVYLTEYMAEEFRKAGYRVVVDHRDFERDHYLHEKQ